MTRSASNGPAGAVPQTASPVLEDLESSAIEVSGTFEKLREERLGGIGDANQVLEGKD